MSEQISKRKDDHIRITKEEDVDCGDAGFDDVKLIHKALPEINKDEIDTSCRMLGKTLDAPILIDSITGGSERGKKLNRRLAAAAEECNIGIGVGSQRAALEDGSLAETYSVVRDVAPTSLVYGNIGAAQLREYNIERLEELVDMIDADALAVHLNFAQEAAQPEGDVNARGCISAMKDVVEMLSVPVMVKETGCGISGSLAKKLSDIGVDIINTGGMGGTSWPYIESRRAEAVGHKKKARVGRIFKSWGIPTAASVVETSEHHPYIVASGGIRSGLDIAKSLALGARAAAAAAPFLEPALKNEDRVVGTVEAMVEELRTAMFVTGNKNLEDLNETETVITGKLREYITSH